MDALASLYASRSYSSVPGIAWLRSIFLSQSILGMLYELVVFFSISNNFTFLEIPAA